MYHIFQVCSVRSKIGGASAKRSIQKPNQHERFDLHFLGASRNDQTNVNFMIMTGIFTGCSKSWRESAFTATPIHGSS